MTFPARISYSPALTAGARPFHRAYSTHARGCAITPCAANSAATRAKRAPAGTLNRIGAASRSGSSRLRTPAHTRPRPPEPAAARTIPTRFRTPARLTKDPSVRAAGPPSRMPEPQPLLALFDDRDRFDADDGVAHEHLFGFARVPANAIGVRAGAGQVAAHCSSTQRRITPATPHRSSIGVIKNGPRPRNKFDIVPQTMLPSTSRINPSQIARSLPFAARQHRFQPVQSLEARQAGVRAERRGAHAHPHRRCAAVRRAAADAGRRLRVQRSRPRRAIAARPDRRASRSASARLRRAAPHVRSSSRRRLAAAGAAISSRRHPSNSRSSDSPATGPAAPHPHGFEHAVAVLQAAIAMIDGRALAAVDPRAQLPSSRRHPKRAQQALGLGARFGQFLRGVRIRDDAGAGAKLQDVRPAR